jgi:FKBP-type peptidyl-prolyl cis-trans isomerase FklB
MNKIIIRYSFIFLFLFSLIACEKENIEDNSWKIRNSEYIDSIASEAKNNPENWKVLLNYKLGFEDPNFNVWQNDDYVYAKVIKEGDKNGPSPFYTDSVDVYYKGSLINGTLFEYNFKEEIDFEIAEPRRMAVGGKYGVITGLATALQYMKIGDRWEIYIPEKLGYKDDKDKPSIPPYSTLIFEVVLEDIIHPNGIDKMKSEEYLRMILNSNKVK